MRHAGWLCLCCLLVGRAPAAEKAVPLAPWWTADQFTGRAEAEQRILALVNAAREKHKQPKFRLSPELTTAARQHTLEMLKEGYFDHESPKREWKMPWDRAYRAGYWEATVAENVIKFSTTAQDEPAAAFLAEEFVNGQHGWMNSPGHRGNILNARWEEIGIGVAGRGGTWYGTQVFGRRWYDLTDLALEAVEGGWLVRGQAKLLADAPKVYLAFDSEEHVVGETETRKGDLIPFRIKIPVDGKRHRIGLHPGKGEDSFWLKWLFFVDTSKPLAEARVMPY